MYSDSSCRFEQLSCIKLFHPRYGLISKIFQRFNNTRKNPWNFAKSENSSVFKHHLAVFKTLQLLFCTFYDFVPHINFEHFSVIYKIVALSSNLEFICLIINSTKVAMKIKLFFSFSVNRTYHFAIFIGFNPYIERIWSNGLKWSLSCILSTYIIFTHVSTWLVVV